jgi:class 3 adenylate cyclase
LPVKRKAGLFLLAVILAVTLGTALVVSWRMYSLVSRKQANQIDNIQASLAERFHVFEVMLRSQHARIRDHMAEVLPLIAADIDRLSLSPDQLTRDQMDAMTKKYGVEDIYFIDRSHKIFQTNSSTDMNMQFPESDFTRFLDSVFGKDKVMGVGIDIADMTGRLNSYVYYGPKGKDYIIETSVDIRDSLTQGDFSWMSWYFFPPPKGGDEDKECRINRKCDLFSDALRHNEYVKGIDVYLVNESAAWSLLDSGKKLAPEIVARVIKNGEYETTSPDGRLVTTYHHDASQDGTAKDDPIVKRLVINEITYDVSLARQAVISVLEYSLIVMLIALPLIFWLSSYLLQRQLLNPLFRLRSQARAIADGDLDHAIADTGRRDEIGNLASSFATMRDAVRRTILDLRETNTSIERFVPKAFLSIMGKPSIKSVKLGDNIRLNMTVLFSDIRNFTGQSEQMTPDENFAFINFYLERMGPVIRANDGFIDKYIGDAIMALFEQPDDALRASLAMVDTLAAFNAERQASGLPPMAIGIGLNTGPLMLGTIGESHRMDGTVISDAVNLAARIESLTKTYGVGILISQNTFDQLADPKAFAIRPIDVVVVKGKTKPVTILEVFDRNPPAEREAKSRTRDLLQAGVEALSRHDIAAARRFFEQCLALVPGDPAATNLLKCCA